MPMLESSATHHYHHRHGPQLFCHESSTVEPVTGKIQLTLILPNGVPSVLNVDANTPMMDLLVHAASLNKLNPSGYSLVVLDSNQHVIHFKANQTVGQVGSSTISLLPKETHSHSTSKPKAQPFEITVRLQVNLPDAQKILLRVDPTLPLKEIKEQICKQKKYDHSNEYTFRLPYKLDEPLLLGLSLAEYKTNELTLVHLKNAEVHPKGKYCPLQSFDRLYRIRSESQPPNESPREFVNEERKVVKEIQTTTSNRSSTLRPSHTSLHAYWNDPNFDTQSQISNCSSITKKRAAPRAPSHVSANRYDPQIVYVDQTKAPLSRDSSSPPVRVDHHQSRESLLSENTKRKRKAPILIRTDSADKKEKQSSIQSDPLARPGLEPPPPPVVQEKLDEEISKLTIDNQSPLNLSPIEQTTSNITEKTDEQDQSLSESQVNNVDQSSPVEQEKIIVQQESPTEKKTMSSNEKTQVDSTSSNSSKLPRQSTKKDKKSSTVNGLLQIVNDHQQRAQIYQEKEQQSQQENKDTISYFRVAKSRFGKFETNNDGFFYRTDPIFDESKKAKPEETKDFCSSNVQQRKDSIERTKKGKVAYELLKKYQQDQEKEMAENRTNKSSEKILSVNKEDKNHAPIQLEVTERTTHITVTVESDAKQTLTRVSPVNQSSGPAVAPKTFGRTITEHRTVRRIGHDGQTTTTIETTNRPSICRESLMESIRQFGGSQNLNKK